VKGFEQLELNCKSKLFKDEEAFLKHVEDFCQKQIDRGTILLKEGINDLLNCEEFELAQSFMIHDSNHHLEIKTRELS